MESSPEEQGSSKLLMKLNYLVLKRGTADNPTWWLRNAEAEAAHNTHISGWKSNPGNSTCEKQ